MTTSLCVFNSKIFEFHKYFKSHPLSFYFHFESPLDCFISYYLSRPLSTYWASIIIISNIILSLWIGNCVTIMTRTHMLFLCFLIKVNVVFVRVFAFFLYLVFFLLPLLIFKGWVWNPILCSYFQFFHYDNYHNHRFWSHVCTSWICIFHFLFVYNQDSHS